ncbi:hypothetical protein Acsp07_52610 [Actinomycetospora sp. NBRC 106378]|nr:hypothetical protein Acsp07_52610 [Actinomycetospora sp. NBRC 106378]
MRGLRDRVRLGRVVGQRRDREGPGGDQDRAGEGGPDPPAAGAAVRPAIPAAVPATRDRRVSLDDVDLPIRVLSPSMSESGTSGWSLRPGDTRRILRTSGPLRPASTPAFPDRTAHRPPGGLDGAPTMSGPAVVESSHPGAAP